jgi:hypothetical protein
MDEVGETTNGVSSNSDTGDDGCPTPNLGSYDVHAEEDFTIENKTITKYCGDLGGSGGVWKMISSDHTIKVLLRRPTIPNSGGTWPEGAFPLVVFTHGNGQKGVGYEHLWDRIVPQGSIFASINDDDFGSPQSRAFDLLCMARWLATEWTEAERVGCNLVLAGHSNGGEGAHIAAKWALESASPEAFPFELSAVFGLAPRYVQAMNVAFDDSDPTEIAAFGVPYLVVQGSLDNDVPNGALVDYEAAMPEATSPPDIAEKVTVWAYDVPHNAFGGAALLDLGRGGLTPLEYGDKGETIAGEYFAHFIRRHVFEDIASTEDSMTGVALPGEVATTQWWDYIPGASGPMLFLAFEPEGPVRTQLDTMDRPTGSEFTPTASEPLVPTTIEPWQFASNVELGPIAKLVDHATGTVPDNAVLRVDWQHHDTGTLAWTDLGDLPLASARHLSLRVGSVLTKLDIDKCKAAKNQNMSLTVGMWKDDSTVHFFELEDYAMIPTQDHFEVMGAGPFCSFAHFMQTVRLPLDELCLDFTPDEITRVSIAFEGSGSLLIDSLEFHHAPDGARTCY